MNFRGPLNSQSIRNEFLRWEYSSFHLVSRINQLFVDPIDKMAQYTKTKLTYLEGNKVYK